MRQSLLFLDDADVVCISLLVAQAKTLDERRVACIVLLCQIGKKAATTIDKRHKAATCAVVLLVDFKMLGQIKNALCQNRNLDFAGTAVILALLVICNDLCLFFHSIKG